MAPRYGNTVAITEAPAQPTPIPTTKVPRALRFPLLVVLNLSFSALLYSLSSEFIDGDLSSVSRSVDGWWQVGGLLGCKTLELAVGWVGDYDGMRMNNDRFC